MQAPHKIGNESHTPKEQQHHGDHEQHADLEVPVEIQHESPDAHRDHGADDLHHSAEVTSSSRNTTINTAINFRAHISRLSIDGELFNRV